MASFDASGFLREASKPSLADAIWAVTRGDETPALCEDESATLTNVLDGALVTTVAEGSDVQRLVSVMG